MSHRTGGDRNAGGEARTADGGQRRWIGTELNPRTVLV